MHLLISTISYDINNAKELIYKSIYISNDYPLDLIIKTNFEKEYINFFLRLRIKKFELEDGFKDTTGILYPLFEDKYKRMKIFNLLKKNIHFISSKYFEYLNQVKEIYSYDLILLLYFLFVKKLKDYASVLDLTEEDLKKVKTNIYNNIKSTELKNKIKFELSSGSESSYTPSYEQSYTPSYEQSYTPSYEQSYTPSYEQSYTPSYEQSYTPSYEQSYTPSYEQSYTPSYEQSYTPSYEQSYTPSYEQSYESGY